MDTGQNDLVGPEDYPGLIKQPQGSPEEVAATSTTAFELLPPHVEPPCDCWRDRIPEDKRKSDRPVPLSLITPSVRTEVSLAIKAFNSIIQLAQQTAAQLHDSTASLPHDVQETFVSHRSTVTSSFDTAAVIISTAPGFVCRQGSAEHERQYLDLRKLCTTSEKLCTAYIKETESLLEECNPLLAAGRAYRRKKYMQTAVRIVSIATIPYSPLFSAVCTAVDTFAISVDMAVIRFIAGEPALRDTLEDEAENHKRAIQEARKALETIKGEKEHLETVKAKLEEQQHKPVAIRLAAILEKVHNAKVTVMGALVPQESDLNRAAPIRGIVASLQDVAKALDAPGLVSGKLTSLNEDQCSVIDRTLAVLRASSPLPSPQALDASD